MASPLGCSAISTSVELNGVILQSEYGIALFGPTQSSNNWRHKVEGDYIVNDFVAD